MPLSVSASNGAKDRAGAIEVKFSSDFKRPQHVGLSVDPVKKKPDARANDDERRNLYVLGIPHHMTLEELKDLFGQFGTVQHAVILAVLDAFRRRRGFIVMNSNLEAAAAMKGMSGATVQNHKFHVSWAVVQRSNGFLDGVDRASGSASGPPSPEWMASSTMEPSQSASSRYDCPRPIKLPPPLARSSSTPSRLVSPSHDRPQKNIENFRSVVMIYNLHRDIFKTPADILPLVEPFGVIERIQIVEQTCARASAPSSPIGLSDSATPTRKTVDLPSTHDDRVPSVKVTSTKPSNGVQEASTCVHVNAIVEFSTALEAFAAVSGITGQVYGSEAVKVKPIEASPTIASDNGWAGEDSDSVDSEFVGRHRDRFEGEAFPTPYYARLPSKKRFGHGYYTSPTEPNSPHLHAFPLPYAASPNLYGYVGAFPASAISGPHSWASSYSSGTPPSPAHLTRFYFPQEGAGYPHSPYHYGPEYSRYMDSRSYHSHHHNSSSRPYAQHY